MSRSTIQEKIAVLDAQLKSRVAEQKVARGRVAFKNVDEIDREIQRLEKGVDAGTMKLVDERQALTDISNLRKQRKGFSRFAEADAGIDDVKKQISELWKTLDNPESRSLSKRFDDIQAEITNIKSEQENTNKNISSIREERTKLHSTQQEKYSAVKDIKGQYNKAKNAYRDYEYEQRKIRTERAKAEQEAYHKERRRKIAEKKLEEASEPAFVNEILAAEGLIRYFEPSHAEAAKSLRGPSGFAAEAQRSVDGSDIKGTRVSKKEDREENYFMGSGGKKGKKGKKGNNSGSPAPSTPTEGKFNLSMGIIEELAKVNVEPPMNQAGMSEVVQKLKEKRDQWKKDQEQKTKEVSPILPFRFHDYIIQCTNLHQNIEKAMKEIERMERSETEAQENHHSSSQDHRRTHNASKKPGAKNQVVNGNSTDSSKVNGNANTNGNTNAITNGNGNGSSTPAADAEPNPEKDAVADVSNDLQDAKIEDKIEA